MVILRNYRRAAFKAALLAGALLLLAHNAQAQYGSTTYLIYKLGMQNPAVSDDNMFDTLERDHGKMREDRSLYPWAVELDIYGLGNPSFGLGIGIEVSRSEKTYHFADGERVHQYTKGVNFMLKTFARLGRVLPYLAGGIGNYYMNFQQTGPSGGLSFRDSPKSVYTGRAGIRVIGEGWGGVLESAFTDAMLRVHTRSGPSKVQLGGQTNYAGLFVYF